MRDLPVSDAAQALLGRCEAVLAPDSFAAALERGQVLTLERAVSRLHLELVGDAGAATSPISL